MDAHDVVVGMDLARTFLQMVYTRSRRYANHRWEGNMTQRRWSSYRINIQ
jgi:hypothetical protein